MTDIEQQVQPTLDALTAAWNKLDFAAVRSLWHPDVEDPWYVAEEETEPLLGWARISDYWARTAKSIQRLSMRTWNLRAKLIADNVVVVLYEMHWNAVVQGFPKPCGGDNRVTALMRKSNDGPPFWRFAHYVEAPVAPLVYLRQYYEASADDDFVAR